MSKRPRKLTERGQAWDELQTQSKRARAEKENSKPKRSKKATSGAVAPTAEERKALDEEWARLAECKDILTLGQSFRDEMTQREEALAKKQQAWQAVHTLVLESAATHEELEKENERLQKERDEAVARATQVDRDSQEVKQKAQEVQTLYQTKAQELAKAQQDFKRDFDDYERKLKELEERDKYVQEDLDAILRIKREVREEDKKVATKLDLVRDEWKAVWARKRHLENIQKSIQQQTKEVEQLQNKLRKWAGELKDEDRKLNDLDAQLKEEGHTLDREWAELRRQQQQLRPPAQTWQPCPPKPSVTTFVASATTSTYPFGVGGGGVGPSNGKPTYTANPMYVPLPSSSSTITKYGAY